MSGGSPSTIDFVLARFGRQGLFAVGGGRRGVVGRGHRLAFLGFVDLHRFAVPVLVGKMGGGAAEIDDREVVFLRVLVDAGATADDLLELSASCGRPSRAAR